MKNIAHRGFSGKYPENTKIAFTKAIELEADMIELDVTLSRPYYPPGGGAAPRVSPPDL